MEWDISPAGHVFSPDCLPIRLSPATFPSLPSICFRSSSWQRVWENRITSVENKKGERGSVGSDWAIPLSFSSVTLNRLQRWWGDKGCAVLREASRKHNHGTATLASSQLRRKGALMKQIWRVALTLYGALWRSDCNDTFKDIRSNSVTRLSTQAWEADFIWAVWCWKKNNVLRLVLEDTFSNMGCCVSAKTLHVPRVPGTVVCLEMLFPLCKLN